MTQEEFKRLREERIQVAYAAVDDYEKKDLFTAVYWARATLEDHEGRGHLFQIVAAPEQNFLCCIFSKTRWSSDYCGRGMPTGSEAIVMAVCEYLNGA